MKKNINTLKNSIIFSTVLFILPIISFAQTTGSGFTAEGGEFGTLLKNILGFINGVLIPFVIGIGFLMFVWGMFKFFIMGGANDEAKEQGKSLMVYATLGFVLIIVFWGIVNLLTSSIGLGGQSLGQVPTVPVGTSNTP